MLRLLRVSAFLATFSLPLVASTCGSFDTPAPTPAPTPVVTAPGLYSLRTTLIHGTSTTKASASTGFTSCHPRYSLRFKDWSCSSTALGKDYLEFLSSPFTGGVYTTKATAKLPNKRVTMYFFARFSFGTSFNIPLADDKIIVQLIDDLNQVVQTIQFTGAEASTGNFGTGYGTLGLDVNGNPLGDDPTKYVAIVLN